MTVTTDNGLVLKEKEDYKRAFIVKKKTNTEYVLKYSEIEFVTTRDDLSLFDLNPEQGTLFLDDELLRKLAKEEYFEFRDKLILKTINAFPSIVQQKDNILSDPDNFILEVPGYIHWGHSIGGSGNICLGALFEAWDMGLLHAQVEDGNRLLILAVQSGLSGFKVGKAYNPENQQILDVQSPLLEREHFYQMVDIRKKYYKYSNHCSLFDLQNFLNNLN